MKKGFDFVTFNCTSQEHYNKVLNRYLLKGYNVVNYVVPIINKTYPF